MQIIETCIIGKKKNLDECEDALFINNNFIAVIDGVTSKSRHKYDGKTTGKIASEIIANAIERFDEAIQCHEAIIAINSAIKIQYEKYGIYEKARQNYEDRFAANVIIYSKYHDEIWSIGDCQCIVDDKLYTFDKSVDLLLSNVRSFYLEGLILNGAKEKDLLKEDKSRELVEKLIKSQFIFENNIVDSKYSYCVLNGFKTNYEKVNIIKLNDAKEITLATDGYPKLYNTLIESEKYLMSILQNDPLCYKDFKSTKGIVGNNISYDDRCYVRFEVV